MARPSQSPVMCAYSLPGVLGWTIMQKREFLVLALNHFANAPRFSLVFALIISLSQATVSLNCKRLGSVVTSSLSVFMW
jgi:hypothetical protein